MIKSTNNILNTCSNGSAIGSFRNKSLGYVTASLFWNPSEGAESVEELNDESNTGDGGFGLSSLPIR